MKVDDYASYLSGIRVRDDFEHPRFDSIVYPCLMIRRGCLDSLEYFEFLVGRSQRLQKMVGHDLARLKALTSQARSLIESDQMRRAPNQPLRMPVSGTPAANAPVAPPPGIAGR